MACLCWTVISISILRSLLCICIYNSEQYITWNHNITLIFLYVLAKSIFNCYTQLFLIVICRELLTRIVKENVRGLVRSTSMLCVTYSDFLHVNSMLLTHFYSRVGACSTLA
jgi:hypothetical protein